jgi:hemolysin III
VLRRADHAAIYLMIAGAYTPIAAIVIGGQVGWALLSFVWIMALIGVGLNIALPHVFKRAPVALYLMIGWALIGAAESLILSMSSTGLWLIAACGAVFTLGLLVFQWARLPFHNAIWHVFVLVGSALLYAAIFVELTSLSA